MEHPVYFNLLLNSLPGMYIGRPPRATYSMHVFLYSGDLENIKAVYFGNPFIGQIVIRLKDSECYPLILEMTYGLLSAISEACFIRNLITYLPF